MDGRVNRVVGKGYPGLNQDGLDALDTVLKNPGELAVGSDGALYFKDAEGHRIRKVDSNNVVRTVVGNGSVAWIYPGDGTIATNLRIGFSSMDIDQNGSIFLASYDYYRVFRISTSWPSFSIDDVLIPSEDGRYYFVFDLNGRHLSTLNTTTGATVYSFVYDDTGLLVSITDANDNTTTINRLPDGTPTTIVAPDGQITTLTLDTNGYLATITEPVGGSSHTMTYYPDGL
ncbi:MAG: hypothetical protein GY820_03650, partial [Gammaproteobacteria bacterium]|nr:hypothetical protein [Gammaproteobacteria bacterium]